MQPSSQCNVSKVKALVPPIYFRDWKKYHYLCCTVLDELEIFWLYYGEDDMWHFTGGGDTAYEYFYDSHMFDDFKKTLDYSKKYPFTKIGKLIYYIGRSTIHGTLPVEMFPKGEHQTVHKHIFNKNNFDKFLVLENGLIFQIKKSMNKEFKLVTKGKGSSIWEMTTEDGDFRHVVLVSRSSNPPTKAQFQNGVLGKRRGAAYTFSSLEGAEQFFNIQEKL